MEPMYSAVGYLPRDYPNGKYSLSVYDDASPFSDFTISPLHIIGGYITISAIL